MPHSESDKPNEKVMLKKWLTIVLMLLTTGLFAQQTQIALLKYRGGGDWYANPTSLPNLV